MKKSNFLPLVLTILCIIMSARGKWMNTSVSLNIKSSTAAAFALYSDLNRHPTWSPWLESVQYDKSTGLSKWTLKQFGIRYSWTAQNTVCNPPKQICWESLDGLPNRGEVEFSKLISQTSHAEEEFQMTLTIHYDLPKLAAVVLEKLGSVGERFIENTLLSDLERFQKRLEEFVDKEKATAPAEEGNLDSHSRLETNSFSATNVQDL